MLRARRRVGCGSNPAADRALLRDGADVDGALSGARAAAALTATSAEARFGRAVDVDGEYHA